MIKIFIFWDRRSASPTRLPRPSVEGCAFYASSNLITLKKTLQIKPLDLEKIAKMHKNTIPPD